MKKLDIYIIKKFLGTFFFAIMMIIVIVIVFDISEKLDDFIRRSAPLKEIIFTYYFNFIPYFINLFSPLFTFIAVVFFTSRMAYRSEITAILTSGINFKRFLVPYFISALFLAILSFVLANFIIPPANAKRVAFEKEYIRSKSGEIQQDFHIQIEPGTFAFIKSFNLNNNTGYIFTLEKIEDIKLVWKLTSDYIVYDTVTDKWQIYNYFIRKIDGLNETIKKGQRMDTTLNIKPEDFSSKVKNVDMMGYTELRKFIANEYLKGSENVQYYEVEKHKRIAFPFATIVLTLIGVSLSSRKVRGGIGVHLGAGITISFAFILFMQISSTFATNGNMPAYIAVWIPNIIFTILGIYLLYKAPK